MKFTTAFETVANHYAGELNKHEDIELLSRICALLDASQLLPHSASMQIRTNFEDVTHDCDDPIFEGNEIGNAHPSSVSTINPLHFYEHNCPNSVRYWSGGEVDILTGADIIIYVSCITVGFDSNVGQHAQEAKKEVKHAGAITSFLDMLNARMHELFMSVYGDGNIDDADFYQMNQPDGKTGNWVYWAPRALKVDCIGADYDANLKSDGLVISYIAYEKVMLGATEQAPWRKMYQYRIYSNGSGDRWYYKPMA